MSDDNGRKRRLDLYLNDEEWDSLTYIVHKYRCTIRSTAARVAIQMLRAWLENGNTPDDAHPMRHQNGFAVFPENPDTKGLG